MAGSSISVCVPRCGGHGEHCYIKTGTRDGPSQGKSFFICSRDKDQCPFVQRLENFAPNFCPKHGQMNELHAFNRRSSHERYYYRCGTGRKEHQNWCGYEILKQDYTPNNILEILSDLSSMLSERKKSLALQRTNPIQIGQEQANVVYKKTHQTKYPAGLETHSNTTKQFNPNALKELQNTTKDVKLQSDSVQGMKLGSPLSMPTKGTFCETGKENSSSFKHLPAATENYRETYHKKQSESSRIPTVKSPQEEVIVISDDEDKSEINSKPIKNCGIGDESANPLQNGGSAELVPLRERLKKTGFLNGNDTKKNEMLCNSTEQSHGTSDESTLSNIIPETASREYIQNLLQKYKNLLASIAVSNLPDQGLKIKQRIKQLQQALDERDKTNEKGSIQPPIASSMKQTTITFHRLGPNPMQSTAPAPERPPWSAYHDPFAAMQYAGSKKMAEMARITRGAIEELHRSLERCPDPNEESPDPNGLTVTLMTHQKQALAWLQWRELQKPSGGILADDMGLGKTLTMISLALKDKEGTFEQKKAPVGLKMSAGSLVICPASLVHQWKKEIDKRVKPFKLSVCIYHGPNREKCLDRLARYDVVLTTYNVVGIEAKPTLAALAAKKKAGTDSQNIDNEDDDDPDWKTTRKRASHKGSSLLLKIFWRRVILDEAHNIKNHKCITSSAVCLLEAGHAVTHQSKRDGKSRWAVTGTPIQNDTMDLYSIIKFLHCSPFDDLKVWKRQVDDKTKRGTEKMNIIVKCLLLRRTKAQKDATGKPLHSVKRKSRRPGFNVDVTKKHKKM